MNGTSRKPNLSPIRILRSTPPIPEGLGGGVAKRDRREQVSQSQVVAECIA